MAIPYLMLLKERDILKKTVKVNVALTAAIEALVKAVDRFEHESPAELQVGDARMLRDCAAVIARCTSDEVLCTLKGMKSAVEV
jgi:hypothetical protein